MTAQGASTRDLPSELSAITRLRAWHCGLGVSTLPAFTNLQHLALASNNAPSSSPEIASLLQLTHLHLASGYATDAMLGAVAGMTCLQELRGCHTQLQGWRPCRSPSPSCV